MKKWGARGHTLTTRLGGKAGPKINKRRIRKERGREGRGGGERERRTPTDEKG